MTDIQMPPGRYFISHSYKDIDIRRKLMFSRPKGVEPVVFHPISVAPQEFVSNALITAILDCDGLIYLSGGHSDKSFWVAFERDFAKRAGIPTYKYDIDTGHFEVDDDPPLNLQIFASCTAKDRPQVDQILEHMRKERFFDITDYSQLYLERVPTKKLIRANIVEKLSRGGYLLSFWTLATSQSDFAQMEIQFAYEYGQTLTYDPSNADNDRVLIARLDDTPLPESIRAKFHQQGAMTEPIQLFEDEQLSWTNRVDNLVVRLYWLIFRNQIPDLEYE